MLQYRLIQRTTAALLLAVLASSAFAANAWHFAVKNNTAGSITKLQTSVDNQEWGDFDVGAGIPPAQSATLQWTAGSSQPCKQWLRAHFTDGVTSPAVKIDFCHDIDTPIEFAE